MVEIEAVEFGKLYYIHGILVQFGYNRIYYMLGPHRYNKSQFLDLMSPISIETIHLRHQRQIQFGLINSIIMILLEMYLKGLQFSPNLNLYLQRKSQQLQVDHMKNYFHHLLTSRISSEIRSQAVSPPSFLIRGTITCKSTMILARFLPRQLSIARTQIL